MVGFRSILRTRNGRPRINLETVTAAVQKALMDETNLWEDLTLVSGLPELFQD